MVWRGFTVSVMARQIKADGTYSSLKGFSACCRGQWLLGVIYLGTLSLMKMDWNMLCPSGAAMINNNLRSSAALKSWQ